MSTSRSNQLPPLPTKPRPIVDRKVRLAPDYGAVKQSGPKPRYLPDDRDGEV